MSHSNDQILWGALSGAGALGAIASDGVAQAAAGAAGAAPPQLGAWAAGLSMLAVTLVASGRLVFGFVLESAEKWAASTPGRFGAELKAVRSELEQTKAALARTQEDLARAHEENQRLLGEVERLFAELRLDRAARETDRAEESEK